MPELALDDHQRNPLVGQLNSVGMAQLMGRKPAPDPSTRGHQTQLPPSRCARRARAGW